MGKKLICDQCGAEAMKVIYAGLPMKMCDNCTTLWGFWAWVPMLWFNGYLFPYEGWYLKALWDWLWLPADDGSDGPCGQG